MSNLRSLATELNQKTINIVKYWRWYAGKTLALFMFNQLDLNKEVIDWKNIKPKPMKLEIKENLQSDATYWNKVTRQEVNLKDQVLTVASVNGWTNTITANVIGPVAYKRGQHFWNPNRQEDYELTTSVSTATVWATTIALVVTDEKNATAGDSMRMSGFTKPYGLAEWNSFDADQVSELFNMFTGANMAMNFDQNEVNSNYIFKNDIKEYLRQKTQEASRKMMLNVWRSVYTGPKTYTSIGWAPAYSAWGLDYYIRNESGIPALNLGTGTWAGTWEICINWASYSARKDAFLEGITQIHLSPLPDIKGANKLVLLCTTPFMREVEKMFEDKLILMDKMQNVDLQVKTVDFAWGKITFICDEMLDDLNRYYNSATGAYDIKKLAYSVPIDYCKVIVKANDVMSKDWLSVPALGMWKYFMPPQTAEETFDLRLYSSYSFIWWGIKSGTYRKINFQR